MNSYHEFVRGHLTLLQQAKALPFGGFAAPKKPDLADTAPVAMFFGPHPDDECISGAICLRLLRQARMRVVNVAVTQGSKKERQAARLAELQAACKYLGFELTTTGPSGLEKVNVRTREENPVHWQASVKTIAGIIAAGKPRVVICPHARDWNSTHIGTHYLVMDALKLQAPDFECYLLESEFWGQMDDPNLTVEMSADDVGDLVTALTFHHGEVNRNPYHLLLPAWMMDNVRRGGELVGGQGGAAPDFVFAVLYRLREWAKGEASRFYEGGKQVPATQNIGELLS